MDDHKLLMTTAQTLRALMFLLEDTVESTDIRNDLIDLIARMDRSMGATPQEPIE
jgi:hypothetical protein